MGVGFRGQVPGTGQRTVGFLRQVLGRGLGRPVSGGQLWGPALRGDPGDPAWRVVLARPAFAKGRFGIHLSSAHLGSLTPSILPSKLRRDWKFEGPSPDPGWRWLFLRLTVCGGELWGAGAQICRPLEGETENGEEAASLGVVGNLSKDLTPILKARGERATLYPHIKGAAPRCVAVCMVANPKRA